MAIRCAPVLVIGTLVFYLNLVLTNLVSLRQVWYAREINMTSLEPLHDTLFVDWVKGYNIEQYISLALRDMVDVCTYSWVLLTILAWWCCSRESIFPAKVISIQMVIVPCFAISQLMTVVPDSQPDCIERYNIPTTSDLRWVFWRWPYRSCGNMLWSSDVAQLVIFTQIAVQMVSIHKPRLRWCVWVLGEFWIFVTMVFIFSSRYQYSMDVFITILVVKLLTTHPWIEHISMYCFVKNGKYYSRAPTNEMVTM